MGTLQDIGHGMLGTFLLVCGAIVLFFGLFFILFGGGGIPMIIGFVIVAFGVGLLVASRKKIYGT